MVSENKKIPNAWDLKRIGDLGEIVTGSTPKTNVDEYWDGDIPFVSPTDMKGTRYIKDTERTVSYKGAQTGRIIPKNSVMVTCIASIGKLAISSQECITNQQINTIIPHKDYNHEFLYYAISNQVPYLQTLAGTTAVPIINKKTFSDVLLPVPPIKEQRKIAAILSSVDEAIEKTEAIIEQTEKVKKGLMQQLLTKGIGHTKFKKTEIGEIPEEWEIVQLQNVTNQITDGTHKTPKYTENGIPFLRVTDIQSEEIDFTKIKYISEREHKELIKRCKPEKGDVLLSKNGTIGLVKVINWDWEFSIFVSLCLIKVQKDKLLPEFLAYFLQSDIALKQFRLRSKQGTVTNLHLIEIRELLCGLPSIEEQYKIVQILNSISKKISKETKKLEILMTIKKGLMQVLLTGKVRVKVDNEVMSQ